MSYRIKALCFSLLFFSAAAAQEQPVTIFVHGTLFPGQASLAHYFEFPMGLTPAKERPNRFVMSRIPYHLHQADAAQFPLESFYLFGWSGALSFSARKEAAKELYECIKKLHLKGQLTVITHSHGGNVALNLAKVVERYKDPGFQIDRLILLACPVQKATEKYLASPIFKKKYAFYSTDDIIQIADPQGIREQWKHKKPRTRRIFSKRKFKQLPDLKQEAVKINNKNPGHLDFILEPFLKMLPSML